MSKNRKKNKFILVGSCFGEIPRINDKDLKYMSADEIRVHLFKIANSLNKEQLIELLSNTINTSFMNYEYQYTCEQCGESIGDYTYEYD